MTNRDELQRAIETMKQRKKCEFCQLADNEEECMKQEDCLTIPYDILKEGYELALQALQEQLDRLEGAERLKVGSGITSRTICSRCRHELKVYPLEKYCSNCGQKFKELRNE